MEPSTCLVSAADYRRYWGPLGPPASAPVYFGPDRRLVATDRRGPTHDRRWEASRGRRFRLADRRRQPQAP